MFHELFNDTLTLAVGGRIDIASYVAGLTSNVERLRSDREAYHVRCEHVHQELQQVRLDIDVIRDTIAEEEKAVAFGTKSARSAAQSGEVHDESLGYYRGEVAELEELALRLEHELTELQDQEPVVHTAASLIQALYRGVRCRMKRARERQRQRQMYTR
jgi:predicted  nucleic acid-binding Zn-ribbon protein